MAKRNSLRNFISAIYAIGLLVGMGLWAYKTHPVLTIPDWVVLYTLSGLLILSHRSGILINDTASMNMEGIYLIGFSMVYPIQVVVWAGIAYAVVSSLSAKWRKYWYSTAANAAGMVLATTVAKVSYVSLFHPSSHWSSSDIVPFVAFGAMYIVATVGAFCVYLLIRTGRQFWLYLKSALSIQVFMVYGIEVLIGLLLTIAMQDAGLTGALVFTALGQLVAWSYRDYFKMANHFKQMAIKDELTGLNNHRYIHDCIDKWIEEKKEFAVLLMDIDHFKRYNEVWGHVRGDEALQAIGQVLRDNKLPDEEQARFSGEEFMILLPDYDLTQAQLKAEILRRAIEEAEFPGAEKLPGRKVTVSIGVARFPDRADNKKELLMMVDDALYKGKFTGRNKVSLYESVLDEMRRDLPLEEEEKEIVKTIKVFLAILNSKDRYTYAHTERDVLYAEKLAERVGLSPERIRFLRFGSFLHDIGKVEVPIEVLTKRGPLTRDEWQIMRAHVEIGENIAKPIPSLAPTLPIIRHHHERFDGAGYPDGLKGENIPLEARILTIADSFDAMTTSRPYQRKKSMEEAFVELRRCAGKQFDPHLVEPFIEVVEEMGLLSDEEDEDLA